MLENALTIVDRDGSVTVTRLTHEFDLDLRIGTLVEDGEDGHWHVEELDLELRCLTVLRVELSPAVPAIELLAA